jgi:predicted RNA binding protein YcfA (HicA-like mRNA interferase family)
MLVVSADTRTTQKPRPCYTGIMSREIAAALRKQGFVEVRHGRHRIFESPNGHRVVVASTVGRGRALQNLESFLRGIGYSLHPKKVGGR